MQVHNTPSGDACFFFQLTQRHISHGLFDLLAAANAKQYRRIDHGIDPTHPVCISSAIRCARCREEIFLQYILKPVYIV